MGTGVSFCFVSLCSARGDVGRRFLEGGRRRRAVLVSLDVRRRRRRRSIGFSDLGSIIPKHTTLAEGGAL